MRQAQFPDGDVVVIATGMTFTVVAATVTVATAGTTVKAFICQSTRGALLLQAQLQTIPDTADGTTTVLVDALPLTLISVSPSPFDITLTPVTIRGTGFTPDVGLLRIEDAAVGEDDNGYSMTCTFVNETTLTAVFNSAGDGFLGAAPALIYYVDGAGNRSNALTGTADAGTNITMPAAGVTSQPSGPGAFSYTADPIGSDANPANANINGSTVTVRGTGFKGTHGAFLVDGTNVIPVTFLSSTTIQAALPAYAAGTVNFDYQYLDTDGNQQTLTAAIAITFS